MPDSLPRCQVHSVPCWEGDSVTHSSPHRFLGNNIERREDVWSIVRLLSRHCSYPRDHEIPSPSALLNEVPSILKSIHLVLKGYFREGWFDLGAHREPGEYNLRDGLFMCVQGQAENTEERVGVMGCKG